MIDGENQTTKIKILKAALNQFQMKGFDGARVDEIAKDAGVNKALIYYYFESKEKMLEAIFEETAGRYIAEKGKQLTDKRGNTVEKHIDEFVKTRQLLKDIVKVAFAESLKENRRQNYLFELVNEVFSGLLEDEKLNKGREIGIQARAGLFFFVTIPELCYIMLGDKWAEYNKTGQEEMANAFRDIYKKILPGIIKVIFAGKK